MTMLEMFLAACEATYLADGGKDWPSAPAEIKRRYHGIVKAVCRALERDVPGEACLTRGSFLYQFGYRLDPECAASQPPQNPTVAI